MPGHPDAAALIAAVREFIADFESDGRAAFHVKVAGNVLAIVERELAQKPDAAEAAVLASLTVDAESMGTQALRADVCAAIRDGRLGVATPGLLDALVAANLARLAVDNPRYSTFLRRTAPAAAAAPQR